MSWLQNILETDKDLFLWLNSLNNGFWDTVMVLITRKETWVPLYLILIYYLIRLYGRKTFPVVIILALTILASDQLSVLIKDTTLRFRPVHDPVIGPMVHNIIRKGSLYGFVSSHAANSFALFAFTSLIFKNRWYSILIFTWASVFSYSRIYAGMHYPLDIICGGILGWIVGYMFFRILIYIETRKYFSWFPEKPEVKINDRDAAVIYVVFAVIMVTILLSSRTLHHYGYL